MLKGTFRDQRMIKTVERNMWRWCSVTTRKLTSRMVGTTAEALSLATELILAHWFDGAMCGCAELGEDSGAAFCSGLHCHNIRRLAVIVMRNGCQILLLIVVIDDQTTAIAVSFAPDPRRKTTTSSTGCYGLVSIPRSGDASSSLRHPPGASQYRHE
jgi:hypothetical protein